ncbi:hypothetical protein GCM10017600_84010 [Streptosporangium carneum]|uniref:Uncharacterized protein n=1 Tax=Streptosporangium carneum TaxID=47481 RepID=A0A9W6IB96_9ACTN|nr:hypothetical protein GCM10017600_84010 [Streptosporangium carneum]
MSTATRTLHPRAPRFVRRHPSSGRPSPKTPYGVRDTDVSATDDRRQPHTPGDMDDRKDSYFPYP